MRIFKAITITIIIIVALFVFILFLNKQKISIFENNINSIKVSNWQTYEDRAYNYSIQYPGDWQLEVLPHFKEGKIDRENIGIIKKKNESFQRYPFYIFIEDNPQRLSAQEWARKVIHDNARALIKDDGEIEINNYHAYQLSNFFTTEYAEIHVYLNKGDKIFIFQFPEPEDNPNIIDAEKNYEIVQKILYSFKINSNSDFNAKI